MKPIYPSLHLLVLTAAITGCVVTTARVRDRAESAFRRQNQLSSDFMLVAPEIDKDKPAQYESLLLKEELMLQSCLPLNALATKQRDGEPVSIGEKRSILGSLDACELATDDFDKSLQDILQETTDRT